MDLMDLMDKVFVPGNRDRTGTLEMNFDYPFFQKFLKEESMKSCRCI